MFLCFRTSLGFLKESPMKRFLLLFTSLLFTTVAHAHVTSSTNAKNELIPMKKKDDDIALENAFKKRSEWKVLLTHGEDGFVIPDSHADAGDLATGEILDLKDEEED